jgi:uncharacterized protein
MILDTPDELRALLERTASIAVVGASNNPARPSYGVFTWLREHAPYTLVPINPALAGIGGIPALPSLEAYAAEHGAPDLVDVFRNPADAPAVTREAIAVGAKAIWYQLGVINDDAIALAVGAGLDVVVDRCLKVEAARFGIRRAAG